MNRDNAFELLKNYVKNPKLISHCIASELIMRKLSEYFGENEEEWGLAGLLHDIDVEITNADPKTHGQVGLKILSDAGIPEKVIEAISRHNEYSSPMPRITRLDHALASGETISGIIFATALVYPDKKISSVKPSSVIKRMKDKRFAASVKRENIMECEKIGIPLMDFVSLCLDALKYADLEF
jgi:putative nucleotidyltransferase with HDIG domain